MLFVQAEDGIRDLVRSRGLGDVYKRQVVGFMLNLNPNGQKTSYEQNGSTYQSDKNNGFNIGIGGFARNYFPGNGSLLPFGQVSLNAVSYTHLTLPTSDLV